MNGHFKKKLKLPAYCAVFLLMPAFHAAAQFKFADIRLITIEDFKGAVPKDSPFPVYTNSRVYYRIDTVIQKSAHKYQVWIKTMVEMYQPASFWDNTAVKNDIPRMLNHEQGHFYIAHIAANKLEEEMPKFNFTENWKEEVKKKFQELNQKFGKMDGEYDNETMHSRNLEGQAKWDKWIKKQLI